MVDGWKRGGTCCSAFFPALRLRTGYFAKHDELIVLSFAIRRDLRTGASGTPIAEISSGSRQRLPVAGGLGFAIYPARGLQRQLDELQTTLRYVVGMLGDWPVRHIIDKNVLVYECSAYQTATLGRSSTLTRPS
jgi:hypothetical protein